MRERKDDLLKAKLLFFFFVSLGYRFHIFRVSKISKKKTSHLLVFETSSLFFIIIKNKQFLWCIRSLRGVVVKKRSLFGSKSSSYHVFSFFLSKEEKRFVYYIHSFGGDFWSHF